MKKYFIVFYVFFVFFLFSQVKEDGVYFVQITDAHVTDDKSMAVLQSAVDKISRIPFKIECVVITGDLVEPRNGEEIYQKTFEILKNIKVPFYYIPGNHELNTSDYKANYDLINKFYPIEDLYSMTIGGYLFVMTNNIFSSLGNRENIDKINALLKKNKLKPALIFGHIPSTDMFNNGTLYKGWWRDNDGLWEKVVNKNNVIAEVAGHYHSDEMQYVGKVPVYVASSLSAKYGRQPSFRLYNISKNQLRYRTIYLK